MEERKKGMIGRGSGGGRKGREAGRVPGFEKGFSHNVPGGPENVCQGFLFPFFQTAWK